MIARGEREKNIEQGDIGRRFNFLLKSHIYQYCYFCFTKKKRQQY